MLSSHMSAVAYRSQQNRRVMRVRRISPIGKTPNFDGTCTAFEGVVFETDDDPVESDGISFACLVNSTVLGLALWAVVWRVLDIVF